MSADPVVTFARRDVAAVLRRPVASDDKYARGVVGLRTGSVAYPGAAVLGVEAAWRTGVGMVRYTGPKAARRLILQRRPETVLGPGRVQAWVVGSGTDAATRPSAETDALRNVLAGSVPVVVDAGALDLAPGATAPVVVTPHAREHAALRRLLGLPGLGESARLAKAGGASAADAAGADDSERTAGRVRAARSTAAAVGAVVLLKGAVTVVAAPSGWTARVGATTPWLATAGTGDVLAGCLGALVAGAAARAATAGAVLDLDALAHCAAAAAWLHGQAGVEAARRAGAPAEAAAEGGPAASGSATDRGADAVEAASALQGPVTALDVAQALPAVVARVLAS